MRALRIPRLLCLGLAAACSSSGDLTDTPLPDLDAALIVSDASPLVDSTGTPISPTTYAYVSLPGGAIPGAVSATVRNRTTGATASATLIEGALDPVPLPAATGDTLELNAADASGEEHQLVNEVKSRVPPVVVRSEPGRG